MSIHNSSIEITLNGESRTISGDLTVAVLLNELGCKGKAIAVEINRQISPRENHETQILKSGDSVEVVSLVGGG